MADFCMQCCREHLGIMGSYNDFIGLTTKEDSEKGLYMVVLCEGCGPTQVDHEGRCILTDCH